MAKQLSWTVQDAGELIDARAERNLAELLPAAPAIYLWRRKLTAPLVCRGSDREFRQWVKDTCQQPSARLSRRTLSYCVWFDGLQVGGGGLSADKEKTLEVLGASRKGREHVLSYIESLTALMPVIYLGQTDNLLARVRSHIDGTTGLRAYITDLLGLSWQDVDVWYVVTSPTGEGSEHGTAIRELLELIAQRIVAPFAVERPG